MRIKGVLMGSVIGMGIAVVTASCIAFSTSGWLDRIYGEDLCFVRTSRYCSAVVLGEPDISTSLYALGPYARYLLVLTSRQKNVREAYYVDVHTQEIGIPDFGTYRPLWRGALVPWFAIEGFPDDGRVTADWAWLVEDRDLRIRIRGLAQLGDGSLVLDSSYFESQATVKANIKPPPMGRLGYGREIVLKYRGAAH